MEKKDWSWKRIEGAFPQRTLEVLQVRYFTKPKSKVAYIGPRYRLIGPLR
jgi:hypothetical protein